MFSLPLESVARVINVMVAAFSAPGFDLFNNTLGALLYR